ncbi:centrosomal protein CEP57L1 isoform X2 [Pristis pectinata]|uniref:centrosomal protein CEP57L1 isoform X2 n=1 Tax=Pristis pectinata TaxID=685728 RepID=UPI00223E56FC|nr:centrosomal protein CEP57L1 isoform X2 [Pristis pectinata]XP_051880949.1 centrosomal protein CEP57L1 isoform X2 [Pristis pectinata]
MGSPLKCSYLGSFCPPSSLENISPSSINVQQRPESRNLLVVGSKNHNEAESPAANSKAIVSALKNLQKKIRSLEVERAKAEQKMQSLGLEAVQYKNTLEQEKKDAIKKTGEPNELSVQLAAVEGHCSLLEKQLEYMRTMVEHAETEKNILLEKQVSLQMDRHWDQAELQSKLEKLEILEQECLKVNATQTRAEGKINELQQRLQEEEHQRKLIQDKAAQLQTGLEINRILIGSSSAKKKTKVKKRKGIVKNEMKKENCQSPRLWPGQVEFPFVAGTSISSSHSVAANVQNVLHLMKHYNTMTSDGRQKFPGQQTLKNSMEVTCDNGRVKNEDLKFVPFSPSSSSLTEGLSEILVALQDELGQMSFEHQDLLKQIQGTKNINVREDLERELDCLVKRMEKKGEQISKLKKHQDHVEKLNLKAKKMRKQMAETKKRSKALDEIKEVTPNASVKTNTALGKKGKESLQLLRNAQKLQLTLRKNDIVWDQ